MDNKPPSISEVLSNKLLHYSFIDEALLDSYLSQIDVKFPDLKFSKKVSLGILGPKVELAEEGKDKVPNPHEKIVALLSSLEKLNQITLTRPKILEHEKAVVVF